MVLARMIIIILFQEIKTAAAAAAPFSIAAATNVRMVQCAEKERQN